MKSKKSKLSKTQLAFKKKHFLKTGQKRFKRPKVQIFNLNDEQQAKEYYNLLEYITKKKVQVPIMAKGSSRIVDFTSKIKKFDFYPPLEASLSRYEKQLLGPLMANLSKKNAPGIF